MLLPNPLIGSWSFHSDISSKPASALASCPVGGVGVGCDYAGSWEMRKKTKKKEKKGKRTHLVLCRNTCVCAFNNVCVLGYISCIMYMFMIAQHVIQIGAERTTRNTHSFIHTKRMIQCRLTWPSEYLVIDSIHLPVSWVRYVGVRVRVQTTFLCHECVRA